VIAYFCLLLFIIIMVDIVLNLFKFFYFGKKNIFV